MALPGSISTFPDTDPDPTGSETLIFRLLMVIHSVYSVFISNYIQTTDGYTLRVFYIYIELYSDYWWIYPPCILYWIHQEAGTLPEEDLLCSVSAGEIVRACTYSNVRIIYYLLFLFWRKKFRLDFMREVLNKLNNIQISLLWIWNKSIIL